MISLTFYDECCVAVILMYISESIIHWNIDCSSFEFNAQCMTNLVYLLTLFIIIIFLVKIGNSKNLERRNERRDGKRETEKASDGVKERCQE